VPLVLVVQRYVPTYRVPLFTALSEQLDVRGVQLLVAHGLPHGTQNARNDSAVSEPWAQVVQELTVPMPGGAAAVREPWRMAAAHLGDVRSAVRDRHADRWDAVVALARSGTASPPTSSVGRLFDAVSALLGVRDTVTYEGQAAIELEQRVDPDERGTYPVTAGDVLAGGELVAAVVEDLAAGVATGRIAARFHHGLADATVAAVARLAGEHGVGTAALSGGVFVNAVLLERVRAGLEAAGLRVLVPTRVPCTDGGIALGQVAVCAARM